MQTASSFARISEFAIWVGAASTVVVVACATVAYAFGDGLLTLKYVLFVVGFALFGLGGLAIQPKAKRRDRKRVSFDTEQEWEIEARLAQLPPLRGMTIPFEKRVSRNVKDVRDESGRLSGVAVARGRRRRQRVKRTSVLLLCTRAGAWFERSRTAQIRTTPNDAHRQLSSPRRDYNRQSRT